MKKTTFVNAKIELAKRRAVLETFEEITLNSQACLASIRQNVPYLAIEKFETHIRLVIELKAMLD